jgi:5-(carboxyamino)imidazole ribonucleotide synthase
VKQGKQVFPQPEIIELIQDKGAQKTFYAENGFPTSTYLLATAEELKSSEFLATLQLPFVQKLRTGGYDGKGVQIVRNLDELMPGPSVIEDLVDIEKEISVIVARDQNGQVVAYDAVEMVFDPIGNLVDYLIAPADLTQKQNDQATEMAKSLITSLGMVGLLAVEMFLTKNGELLINEVAPRPHNSGHHTIENTDCSQYEQLLRCLLNAPLIPGIGHRPAMMINILGGLDGIGKPRYNGLDEIMTIEGVHLFLYGKKETRPFRKLGHFTIVGTDKDDLLQKANIIKSKFSVSCEQ